MPRDRQRDGFASRDGSTRPSEGGRSTRNPHWTGHIPEHLVGAPQPLNRFGDDDAAQRFGFLLVPGFTYIGFASAIEPLRMANMVAHARLFQALTVTTDGEPVRASNGTLTVPDCSLDSVPPIKTLFVCGPNPIRFPEEKRLVKWLNVLVNRGTALGGIDTGSYLLARARLLKGYRCTIHWTDMENMLSRFPDIIVSDHIFEIDRDRFTSSGGTAPMDMMLQIISRLDNGPELAAAVADLLIHDRIRADHDRQRVPLRQRFGTAQPKLREAVRIMEANLEDPVCLPEIAAYIGLSERQMQRLFQEKLACTPGQYYTELRLSRARQRLLHTDEPVSDVARNCGFQSNSYFAKRYAQLFGVRPIEDRRRNLDEMMNPGKET